MRKAITAILASAMIGLGGCVTTGGSTSFDFNAFNADVIAALKATGSVCKTFVPTAEAIAQVVAAENVGVITATAVADVICEGVLASTQVASLPMPKARRLGLKATVPVVVDVNGKRIVVTGAFVS